jgi:hypothetical protein
VANSCCANEVDVQQRSEVCQIMDQLLQQLQVAVMFAIKASWMAYP